MAVLCSCVKFTRTHIPELPPIYTPADLEPNTYPYVGSAALFNYGGTHHIAVVTALNEGTFSIIESNYRTCTITEREVSYLDASLRGFWKP